MKVLIYALVDPRNDAVRYIGLTRNIVQRMSRYRHRAHTKHLSNWFSSLKSIGLFPYYIVLQETEEGIEADTAERDWIKWCRENGLNLINYTNGGESAYIMDESVLMARRGKARIDRGRPRRPLTEKTKQKISDAHKLLHAAGLKSSNFGDLNKSRIGIPLTEAHRLAVSRALKGKPKSESHRQGNLDRLKKLNDEPLERKRRSDLMRERWHQGHFIPPVPKERMIAQSNVKLNPDQVREIRDRLRNGATNRGLATEYGVGKTAIGDIRTGKKWGWLV